MTSTLGIIKQILDKELNLPTGRCFAYNSEIDLPKDNDIFICLYYAGKSPYSNKSVTKNTEAGFVEIQTMNVREDIEIAICSRNIQARERCHEVLMALRSNYSQQIQEKNSLHISNISEIFDNSFLESTARLNRFDTRISVMRAYEKINNIEYYDKFSGQITIENNYNDTLTSDV